MMNQQQTNGSAVANGEASFAHLPPNARGHFLLHFYAAVHRLIAYARRLDDAASLPPDQAFAAHPFLAGYHDEIRAVLPAGLNEADAPIWWEQTIVAWEASVVERLPLREAARLGVGFDGRLAILLAGMADIDSRLGTLFAQIQAPLGQRRPSLETIGQILASGWSGGLAASEVCRDLLRCGLLELVNPDAPRAEWGLRPPALIWDLLTGRPNADPAPWCHMQALADSPAISELILPDDLRTQVAQLPALIRSGTVAALVLRGSQGSERAELVGAVGRALGMGLAQLRIAPGRPDADTADEARWRAVGPLCTLAGVIPLLNYDLGPGESVEPPRLEGYDGPVAVLLGAEGGLRGPLAERALSLSLPMPDVALRRRHWRAALPASRIDDMDTIAERFVLPGGYIRQAAGLALAQAALAGRKRVGPAHVRAACRSLNRQLLDSLAARVEGEGGWEHLVVNPTTDLKLRELERRCRHRERLDGRLGPAFGKPGRGVRALFSGSSGTGKTLAARILAAELGMDLYRVDLSAVVNKYIGETEKNLHRVLSRAEELDVVLLLDEGDSLLGGRTEVKSANDRYANLETNYLLQRLESYQGIVLVTTNASQLIDRAFQRRLDVVVPFVPPDVEQRRQIWALHLPGDHALPSALLDDIAARCALSGGQIRNAAMLAALLALDADTSLGAAQLTAAIDAEYRKAGALCPLGEAPRAEPQRGIDAFLNAIKVD
jgi:predicted nucleic acid-binding protein